MNDKTRIVLFCGGRGSATIIRALLRNSAVELTLLVNAYDDGLSTGALRNFIPGMLGASDFRKNLSYLLGNYSEAQYALKNVMEYRLPAVTEAGDIERLARFARTNNPLLLSSPLKDWFVQISPDKSVRVRALLGRFFDHAASVDTPFDYRDCSLGNLVFAGAYLARNRDFNAAAADVGNLVGSRATLLNVSEETNRHLSALKQDGSFLSSEAAIVGPQSPSPIARLYLLEKSLTVEEIAFLSSIDMAGKQAFLAERDRVPNLSAAAAHALASADIILYGPGTQHSSLLPSYRIAAGALAASPAPVKALIVNLDGDHDIQGFTASDLVQRAVDHGAVVSDILLNADSVSGRIPQGILADTWHGARIWRGTFATPHRPQVHNGEAITEHLLALLSDTGTTPTVEIFADIHNRSVASDELVEEFLETAWVGDAHLTLNRVTRQEPRDRAPIANVHLGGLFPEATYFRDWLVNGTSDYLVLMTGDGAYRFRDVQAILRLMERQPSLGGVFGSRTQSRRQFITSIQAAYGENRILYWLGKIAAFFLSMAFYLRSGVIFSDPLTGLRVFRRRQLEKLPAISGDAPLAIVRQLVKQGVEVAELPVLYRTFSGFTDPNWRVRRGLRNLLGLL